jgi:hypothetical protein
VSVFLCLYAFNVAYIVVVGTMIDDSPIQAPLGLGLEKGPDRKIDDLHFVLF